MRPDPAASTDPLERDVAAAVRRYRLALRGRFCGGVGGRRGLGAGGAQDFHDFRDYAPGDDLRHLDWRGFARTDQLRVRMYEEEVAPFGDVLLDLSPSMASTPQKQRATLNLARLLLGWIGGEGGRGRCLQLGGGAVPDPGAAVMDGPVELAAPAAPLRSRGVRVVVSDFLVPGDPLALLRRLAVGAARFIVVQLLDPWERDPQVGPAATLQDCETGLELEVSLDAATIAAYRRRLERLQSSLRTAVQAAGGLFVEVLADAPEAMCRRWLLPAGVVEPAA